MSIIWENSVWAFLLVTLLVCGGAAWMAGRGIALSWRPTYQIYLYMALLAAVARFLHFALYEGTLLSLYYYLIDLAVMMALGWLGFQFTRTNQMVRQYHWLYEKVSPLSWKAR